MPLSKRKKKRTKILPRVSANRSSNNWTLVLFFFQVKVKVDNVDDGDHDRDQMLKMIVVVLTMMTTVMLIMVIVCIKRSHKCVDSSFNQKKKFRLAFVFNTTF